ncbi:ABC transporter permease [Candidatus Lokiarchaeum ossiferum]|uniref:ABC transporter permease n=1 Tax=Candidatus Lokiarchaeum ossiferum TaxID=2951803 RepID=UPI00352FC574
MTEIAAEKIMQPDPNALTIKTLKTERKFGLFLKRYKKQIIPLSIFLLVVLFAFIGSAVVGDPEYVYEVIIDGRSTGLPLFFAEPQSGLPLGTNQQGYSWFAVLLHSFKNSLKIGFTAGIVCVVIAVFVGLIGPFLGGAIDDFFVFITNIFLVFPVIPFILLLGTMMEKTSVLTIEIVIALFNWPWAARSIRSQVLSLRERDFVKVSKTSGLSEVKIAIVDIIPNMFSYIFLVFTILINVAILTEAGIAILGLGQSDMWTLGRMLDLDRKAHIIPGYYHLWIPTGLSLTLFLVLMYVINTNLTEVFNPRLREK